MYQQVYVIPDVTAGCPNVTVYRSVIVYVTIGLSICDYRCTGMLCLAYILYLPISYWPRQRSRNVMNKHRPRQRLRECNESVINDVTAGLCNSRKCVRQLPYAQGSH